MPRWLAGWASALVALAVTAPAYAEDKIKESPYFPSKVGTTWTYKLKGAPGVNEMTQKVAKHEKIGNTLCARLESKFGDVDGPAEHIGVADKGVARFSFSGVDLETPLVLLQLPPKKGESWNIDLKVQNEALKGKFTNEGEEEIEVPAGKYKAFKVVGDCDAGGMKVKFIYYFAKDVGVVKQVIEGAGINLTSELAKFEAGK